MYFWSHAYLVFNYYQKLYMRKYHTFWIFKCTFIGRTEQVKVTVSRNFFNFFFHELGLFFCYRFTKTFALTSRKALKDSASLKYQEKL